MNNTELNYIKSSTKTLGSLLSQKTDAFAKLDIIIQLRKNLEYLQNTLSSEEYTEYKEIENNMRERLERLSDPSFISKLKLDLSGLINDFRSTISN
ncbi:hypothetical protein KC669_02675 [Candidatus Dojkabacteria bacterium]|uniref:Uncharacterized protein n=1 Tax=Candidatus Dojkabacteria bacterium TaxID=2099670 RepID=A0A955LA30_9BACT|nr:hypothetical protein [Candidatus Dojkabacteria bacterium]